MKFVLGGFLLLACAVAQADATPHWQGPLPMQNGRPFQSIFLHLPQQDPNVLPIGQNRFGVQLDVANNLLIPAADGTVVQEDFETQTLKLDWGRGLGHGLEAGFSTQIVARNGGFLDGPIQWWHDAFGMTGMDKDDPIGRGNIPKGRSILYFNDENNVGISKDSAFGLGDTTLSFKKQLSTGRFSSAARIALKLPTGSGNEVLGSGGFDLGAAIDARYALSQRVALFGQLGANGYGHSDVPKAESNGWQAGLGVELHLSKRSSLIGQIDAQRRAVTTGNAFADRRPVIGSIGYKRRVGANHTAWASFSENGDYHGYHTTALGDIGPDFSVSAGYTWSR